MREEPVSRKKMEGPGTKLQGSPQGEQWTIGSHLTVAFTMTFTAESYTHALQKYLEEKYKEGNYNYL